MIFSQSPTPQRVALRALLFAFALMGALPASASVRINEVQSTNTSFPDQHGQLMDWVELHNPTGQTIDLTGYYLSDSLNNRLKHQFSGVSIAPGGFLLVWCGQAAEFPVPGPYPAGQTRANTFAISSGGEPVVLTAPDGQTIVDQVTSLAIPAGQSLGRGLGSSIEVLYFYASPTPGVGNTTPGTPTETLPGPAFSSPGGMYPQTVNLELSTPVVGGTIRYTLDGSDPTESSPAYSGPLNLTDRTGQPNVYSAIPTNRDLWAYDEGWQPPEGQVFKINVVRARVFKAGSQPSPIATQSYLVHPAGTARYPFPVVSINSDPTGLFSNQTGIYVHGNSSTPNYTQDWDRPGYIEFFEADGSLAFQGPISVELHGNTSVSRPRKSLRITSRLPGNAPFQHQLFPQKGITQFSTFLLRNSGNDWGQSLLRDAFVTGLAAHTGLDVQSSRPAVVFINGEYWGLHNVRDRIDEGYYLTHHGLGANDFTQLDVHWQPVRPHWPVYDRGNPSAGMLEDFEDILNRAANNEFAPAGSFETLAGRIDVDNYINYNAWQIFAANGDWPGNNTRLWRSVAADRRPEARPTHDGRWRWILFDTDFGLGLNFDYVPGWSWDAAQHAQVNTLAIATSETQTTFANAPDGTLLLRKLTANPVFRQKFISRFADLLNTSMNPARTVAELDRIQALYAPGISEHKARWRQPYNWTNDMARIRTFLQARPAAVRGHLASKFGLPGTADLTVDVTDTNRGTVSVNSISIDPSTPGVSAAPYPWTGTYFRGVPVTVSAQPKPGFRFVSWADNGATNSDGSVSFAADATPNYPGSEWASNTPNGGTGFEPWIFNDTSSWDDGFFIGPTGRDSMNAASPDGRAFGIFAHSGGSASATRPFSTGPLETNQTFSVTLSTGGFSGTKGVLLGQNGTNRFGFTATSVNGTNRLFFTRGSTNTPIEATFGTSINQAFNVSVTRTGGNNHTFTITRGSSTFTTNFTATGPVDRAVFFNRLTSGSSDANNLYLNNLALTAPPDSSTLTNAVVEFDLLGPRRLIANFEPEPATALAVRGSSLWTLGYENGPIEVHAVNSLGDTDSSFNGLVTLTISTSGGVGQTLQATAVNGVASFAPSDLSLGTYSLAASAGTLATTTPAPFTVKDTAIFLPAGSGSWHSATNWDVNTVPGGPTARVHLPSAPSANRDVTLAAPVTVAAISFDLSGSSFRNRLNGPAGSPLTLQSSSGPAIIRVDGAGSGHANLELTAGAVLQSDTVLEVGTTDSANQEYGALRLQGNWSGPGGLIKRGPGLAGITGAGKTFSGDVVVEQGTLTFTEPAITGNNVTNYRVLPGGQLRLSSAGSPRNYLFKGPLHLAGSGRSGVPAEENLGVLGALRLETGTTGTTAVLTNQVNLTASADIHAPAGNSIRLQGPLTGSATLTKSGGGTLTLDPAAAVFGGGVTVHRGTLLLNSSSFTNTNNLTLAPESILTGRGAWNGLLQVQAGAGLSFDLGAAPEGQAPLRAASAVVAGPAKVNITPATNSAPGHYPLLRIEGSISGSTNLVLDPIPAAFPASRLFVTNQTLTVDLRAALTPRESWLQSYGLPRDGSGEGADDADPDRDGLPNILEQALDLNPVVPGRGIATGVSTLTNQSGRPTDFAFTYRQARNTGITLTPLISTNVTPGSLWWPVTPSLVDDTHPSYRVFRITLPMQSAPRSFIRLRAVRPANP